MKAAFDKISAGLEDAIGFAGGDTARGLIASMDVGAIRASTKLTQNAFSKAFRVPLGTLRDWEQNRRQPDAPARVLLSLIAIEPKTIERLLAKVPIDR